MPWAAGTFVSSSQQCDRHDSDGHVCDLGVLVCTEGIVTPASEVAGVKWEGCRSSDSDHGAQPCAQRLAHSTHGCICHIRPLCHVTLSLLAGVNRVSRVSLGLAKGWWRHGHSRALARRSVSPGHVVSSSIGASVRCRRCPAGPAGRAPSRRSGCSATWAPPWPRPCRNCRPASGAHSPPTSDVSDRVRRPQPRWPCSFWLLALQCLTYLP